MADKGNQQETIQCSRCKKRFFEDGFKVTRLGQRNKTCLECNARKKAELERNKCSHGRQRSVCCECGGGSVCPHRKVKWDCQACSPEKFCEHGKAKIRHTCVVCDAAGNERRKHLRNAREFANQSGGWPYEHVRCSWQEAYNAIVNKWKTVFENLLTNGEINEDFHAKILANLKPWDAEGHAASRLKLTDDDLAELLGFAL